MRFKADNLDARGFSSCLVWGVETAAGSHQVKRYPPQASCMDLKQQPSSPFTFDPARVVAGLRYLTPDFRPGLFTLNPSRVLAGVLAPQRGVISPAGLARPSVSSDLSVDSPFSRRARPPIPVKFSIA
jgi:hypothetical protein